MNRRAFLGAFGVVLAAPIAALAMKFQPIAEMAWQHDDIFGTFCTTLNGEDITSLQEFAGELYAFTASAVYRVPRVPENEPLWAFR